MSRDEQAIRDLVDQWMTASKVGDTATVLGLMAEDIVFTAPGQKPFGKKVFAENSKAMKGVKFEGSSEIVESKIIAHWAWLRNHIRAV